MHDAKNVVKPRDVRTKQTNIKAGLRGKPVIKSVALWAGQRPLGGKGR